MTEQEPGRSKADPSVAFLVLNHRPAPQLARLVAALDRGLPGCAVVIHHDRFHAPFDRSVLPADVDTHVIESDQPLVWGGFALVEAYWSCLRWMAANLSFDWVVLLSGQDYPIKPLSGLPAYLDGCGGQVLMEAEPLADMEDRVRRSVYWRRYRYQYPRLRRRPWTPETPGRMVRLLYGPTSRLMVIANGTQPAVFFYWMPEGRLFGYRPPRNPLGDMPFVFSSNWITMSRSAVGELCDFLDRRPEVSRWFARTLHPDEGATATVVAHLGLPWVNTGLHHTRWSTYQASHPDVLTGADIDELAHSDAWFARKLDLDESGPLFDLLDDLVAEPETPGTA